MEEEVEEVKKEVKIFFEERFKEGNNNKHVLEGVELNK